MPFPHLESISAKIRKNPEFYKTKEGLIELICKDCEFWREDERDYECGAFKLFKELLQKEALSPEDILRAVKG